MTFSATLRHQITIQQRQVGSDTEGAPLTIWSDVAKPYADVRVLAGLESIKAGAVTSTARASIRIRYREGLDPSMRVIFGGAIYQIVAVLPDHVHRRHLDLACELTQ